MTKRRDDTSCRPSDWTVYKLLTELRKTVNYERASFAFPDCKVITTGTFEPRDDSRNVHPDDFIKERTRLHRETWIIPLIEELEKRFL